MASLLVGKSREDWFDVCNSPGFYRGKGNQQVEDTEWILSLSYYDLPSYLRTCLLYLSAYPEDYEIHKESLIWKWIAEGFIEKKIGTTLFQQGEEYFNHLVNRSMIQAVKSSWEDVYAFRVHDMVLDLIRGLSNKENFVTISNDDEGTFSSRNKVRRLAHQKRMMKQSQQDDHTGMAQVRSLLAYSCDIDNFFLHPSFKLLRVLDLEGCRVSEEGLLGLEHLENLLHLRYIGLRHTYGIYKLPEEIEKLKFIQILDLEGSSIDVLPLGICRLTQLVCLRGGFSTRVPDGLLLTKVTSLEELCIRISNKNEESRQQFMKDLGSLSEARALEITCSFKGMVQSDLVQSLGNLHKLQRLCLYYHTGLSPAATRDWDTTVLPQHLRHLSLSALRFQRMPSWIRPACLPSLRYLCLDVDDMDEAGLRALGGLPELRILRLRTLVPSMPSSETTANIIGGDAFFQKLGYCDLYGWIVQLVLNEDCTSVSFTMCNRKGAKSIVGPSEKEDESSRSVAPLPVMPNLQELRFDVPVRALYKDGKGGCDNLGLQCLPSLRTVQVRVDCEGASAVDMKKAEAGLRNAAQLHPKRPIIEIKRRNTSKMMGKSTDREDEASDQQEGDVLSAGDEVAITASTGDGPAAPSC